MLVSTISLLAVFPPSQAGTLSRVNDCAFGNSRIFSFFALLFDNFDLSLQYGKPVVAGAIGERAMANLWRLGRKINSSLILCLQLPVE
jgi:hypothetical protein